MKVYTKESVLQAAERRISFVFDEFDNVIVASSGGKDSTAIMELAAKEAAKRGRLPLKVMFIDQEAEWDDTIRYMEYLLDREDIELWWVQLPLRMENSSSYFEGVLDCWNPEKQDVWIHPQNERAITENIFGKYDRAYFSFYRFFDHIYPVVAGADRFAVLYGLRAEESQVRSATVTMRPVYKNVTWSSKAGRSKGDGFKFAAIYDWRYADVWTAIAEHEWEYNRCYDKQFQIGVPASRVRVSSLFHAVAAGNALKMVQEIDPDLYERLTIRLQGADTSGKLGEHMRVINLPPAFATWREYVEYLMSEMLGEKNRRQFEKLLESKRVQNMEKDEEFWFVFSGVILNNDTTGVAIENWRANKEVKDYKRERKYAK